MKIFGRNILQGLYVMLFTVNDYQNLVRYLDVNFNMEDGTSYQHYPIVTMGRRSYFEGLKLMAYPPCHLLVGHYVSIASGGNFLINIDHDCVQVSNYPMFCVRKVFNSPFIMVQSRSRFIVRFFWKMMSGLMRVQ